MAHGNGWLDGVAGKLGPMSKTPLGPPPVLSDLYAGIIGQSQQLREVLAKIADWLAAGTKLVWLVDPQRSEVHVYRRDGSLSVLRENDALDGEEVLPGFTCPLRHVFA